jgi:hypothetical protein
MNLASGCLRLRHRAAVRRAPSANAIVTEMEEHAIAA